MSVPEYGGASEKARKGSAKNGVDRIHVSEDEVDFASQEAWKQSSEQSRPHGESSPTSDRCRAERFAHSGHNDIHR